MKSDLFDNKIITLVVDKPYIARFTMRAVFQLERIYGGAAAAVRSLDLSEPETAVTAVIRFACLLSGIEPEKVEDIFLANTGKFYAAFGAIRDALIRDLPGGEGAEDGSGERGGADGWDWDWLYYTGRYRLRMTDEEFWDSTPRRVWKLNRLWLTDRGLIKTDPVRAYIDEIDF